MEIAKKDSTNPFFKSKYSDLNQIVSAARPSLSKYGLSVIQRIKTNGNNQMYLHTRLCHASGQWIEAKMPINPPKTDIQSLGSYITYLRRYNFASIVGVTVGEEDDDGESTMNRDKKSKEENAKDFAKQFEDPKKLTITPTQIRELEILLFDLPDDDLKSTLAWCQIKELNEMPQEKFASAKKSLEKRIAIVRNYQENVK
jgi:hypothetical protein